MGDLKAIETLCQSVIYPQSAAISADWILELVVDYTCGTLLDNE